MTVDQSPMNQLITEHIDIWTSAVKTKSTSGRGSSKKLELYGVKKLRELILELAVRGKLIPQDPSDEPAKCIITKASAMKEELTQQKKIRKQKPLPLIRENETPFKCPTNWLFCRMGDLGLVASSSRVQKKDWTDSGIPFYRAREIVQLSRTGSVDNELFISESLFETLSENSIGSEAGDIMLTGVGTIGVPYVVRPNDRFYYKDASVLIFKNLGGIISEYLALFMYSPLWKRDIHEESMGTTVHTLTIARAANTVIPVPPIEEQHRIVAKVDELMTLCDQLEQQTEASIEAHQVLVTTLLDTLTNSADADELMQNWARISEHFDTLFTTEESIDQLKQTILQLAVMGKLVHFGADPMETYVMDVISFGPRNGLSPKEVQVDTGIKVLKLGATSYGSLNLDESKSVDVDIEKTSHLWLKKGDILIQRGNSANYVGCNCLVKEDVCDVIYPDLMMKIRPSKTVSSEFLSTWLSSPMAREFMWTRMTGTSGTMPKISKKVVEAIPIIVPSRKIQDIIVSKVEELFSICDLLKQLISETQQTQSQLTDTIVEQAI